MIKPEVEAELLAVIGSCHNLGVPCGDLEQMIALTTAGEPGVALENLCEQLFEYDANVPVSTLERLTNLARELGVRSDYVARLAAPSAP